jgi:hypothetical protein
VRAAPASAGSDPGRSRLAESWLALVPLLVAYEFGARASAGGARSAAELLVLAPVEAFADRADWARALALAALTIAAAWRARRGGSALLPAVLRAGIEGALGAALLGPVLVGLLAVLPEVAPAVARASAPPAELPSLARTALAAGSGAWEEIVFRLGAYSACYLLAARALRFAGPGQRAAAAAAEVLAAAASSLVFAAFHLDRFVGRLGPGGEPFDEGAFWWRALAGLLLAVLYRWRGLGAAAWTHALFNASLVLGASPGVFLSTFGLIR